MKIRCTLDVIIFLCVGYGWLVLNIINDKNQGKRKRENHFYIIEGCLYRRIFSNELECYFV